MLDVAAIDLLPVVRLENIERARVNFSRRTADAVFVVLDDEEHRQLSLFRKTNRLEKIALARGGVAHRGGDDVRFVIELDSPRDAARGEKL